MKNRRDFIKNNALFVSATLSGCLIPGLNSVNAGEMADILASLSPNSPAELLRSLRVILPNQDNNIIKNSWPGIGCWFWTEEEFRPEGYKRFLDLYAKHTNLSLITTSLRYPVEITDREVHARVKEAVRYGQSLGLEIVMDLDVRLARESFHHHYPDELQEFVRMRDVQLINEGETYLRVESINLSDHYTMATRGYDSIAARVLRVFIFNMGPGGIEKETITDITDRVKTTAAGREGLEVMIPVSASEVGKTVCVMAAFTLFTPDLFSPNLMQFDGTFCSSTPIFHWQEPARMNGDFLEGLIYDTTIFFIRTEWHWPTKN
jgi:hypothetical protein